MSSSQDDIRVRIAGDLADIRKALQDLRRETRDAGKQARDSGRDWGVLGDRLDALQRRVVGLVGGYLSFRGAVGLLRGVIRNTVQAEQELAQLTAALQSTGQAAGLTRDELVAMAEDFAAQTAFSSGEIITAQTRLLSYSTILRDEFPRALQIALDQSTRLGIGVEQSAEIIGRALETPSRGVASLTRQGFQFTQAQREMLRSLEETGRLAEAQAIVMDVLEESYAGAARAARQTLGGAFASLRNAISELLEARGPSVSGLTAAVEEFVDTLRDPRTIEAFQNFTSLLITMTGLVTKLATGFVEMGRGIGVIVAQAVTGIENPDDLLSATLEHLEQAERRLTTLRARLAIQGRRMSEENRQLIEEQIAAQEQLIARLRESAELQRSGRDPGLARRTEEASAQVVVDRPVDARPGLRRLQADLAAAGILLRDELKRLQAELDQLFEDNLVSFREFFARRAELEARAIDQQIAEQRAVLALLDEEMRLAADRGEDLAKQEAERAKLVAQITVLERQRGDVASRAARDQARAEAQLQDQLARVRERLLEIQGQGAEARALALEREFSGLLERLQVEGDAEGEALVRNLIDVELARARLSELEDEYSRTLSRLARQEQSIQVQIDAGVISEREGRRRIIELHQRTADEVEQLIPLMRQLAEETGNQDAIARLEELELELQRLRATADNTIREFKETVRDAGEEAFASFIAGAQRAGDAWDSFVDRIKRRSAEILTEGIFDRIAELLRGSGGVGGAVGGIASFLAGIFHDGGVVGRGGRSRRVPALAFAGAPRLHNGGLAPNERAAVLQVGEEVITRRDPRHRDNFGGGIGPIFIETKDAESFRRQSPGQLGADFAAAIIRARNRNG